MATAYQQQQQFMIPQTSGAQYLLVQQPIPSVPIKMPGQVITEKQQQLMQTLTSLKQQILSQQIGIGGIEQQPPVYFIRTIEQPGQVFRQVQQISEPMISPQYMPAIPIQQAQVMLVPSMQQMIPQTQPFILPLQIPMQTVTLQVPGKFDTNLNMNYKWFFILRFLK